MKFSIVTPAFNSERYIAETMESVISQEGDFEIEYIVADGGSTDGTVEILKEYEGRVKRGEGVKCAKMTLRWFSEKDKGMYDAINKGFALATGDIYAWVNSDDKYLPGAFAVIQRAFQKFPEIKWLKGEMVIIDGKSLMINTKPCILYDRSWISKGVYDNDGLSYIDQADMFWRSELWDKAGGLDASLRLAGDYGLWIKFAGLAKLYSIRAYVSCYRRHAGQLSTDKEAYTSECRRIVEEPDKPLKKKIKMYLKYYSLPLVPRQKLYRVLFGAQDLNYIEVHKDGSLSLEKSSYFLY